MKLIDLQTDVAQWVNEAFGEEIAADKVERNHRFLEEALELVQALGCTRMDAHSLVDYVFERPIGEPKQETGGVLITLMALCNANSIFADSAAQNEIDRVWKKIEQIRTKQSTKPKFSFYINQDNPS